MTFAQFQESRVWFDDLADMPDWQYERDEPSPGYRYLDTLLYIDRLTSGEHAGQFDLVIGNQEWVDADLSKLERHLYDFAVREGYCGEAKRLTWRELSALENGTRVQFVEAWDIFPITVVAIGTVGTLVANELNEITSTAAVVPDDRKLRHDLAEWDGEIDLSPYFGGGTSASEDEEWDALSPLVLAGE